MGDPRGFLKVRTRRELAERPVEERIKDWFDVHAETGLQPWTQTQAARCMDCGTPFCMTGCPLGNLIPEWNDLVRQGKWEDAYNRLSMTNNFPEVTGRICPALCEQACVLGIHQPPTMIKLDEQTIIDQAWDLDYVKPLPPQRLTDQTVAVVGSGPAGLAAAQQLTRAGHTVVVYEKDDAIGGLMRYGIPNFKLEKGLLDRRVKQMEAEGTRFRTNVEIGKDITWDDLRDRYDAVVVAIGSRVPRDMKIPGRELDGIHFALDFLPDATRRIFGVKPGARHHRQGQARHRHRRWRHRFRLPRHLDPSGCEGRHRATDHAERAVKPSGQQPVADLRPHLPEDLLHGRGRRVHLLHRLRELRGHRRGEGQGHH